MAVHDAFARQTPYELSVPDRAFAEKHFTAIREEAEARGVALGDPTAFVMLAAAGKALRAVRIPDDDPALIHQYGRLLYHAFHFDEAGAPLYLLAASALRSVLEGPAPSVDGPLRLPTAGGYAQLPHHLVWIQADGDAAPESLDGFFWTRSADDRFELLLALGMRADRPGLSVVPLADLPLAEAPEWAAMAMREGEADFVSSLPGSELEGLYELRSAGEALKLAVRVLARLGSEEVAAAEARDAVPTDAPAGPRASTLAYRRIE